MTITLSNSERKAIMLDNVSQSFVWSFVESYSFSDNPSIFCLTYGQYHEIGLRSPGLQPISPHLSPSLRAYQKMRSSKVGESLAATPLIP